jgi:hypothetical protein
MNEHLRPIFEIVLPKITSTNIPYWVYGGLGYASMVGAFYRNNPDVDLFVLDIDFEKVENILQTMCQENAWNICKTFIKSGRPKLELHIKEKEPERLSVIPVCKSENSVKFRFREGSKVYSLESLTPVKRNLGGYVFTTPPDDFLKILLVEYLASKSNYPGKRIEDAKHILLKEEFQKYFPAENTQGLPD